MISVIIPVYNVYDYIDKCVESVVSQTYHDLEILIINDGSTDQSEKKCLEWSKKDTRIKLLSKANEGLGPTRNLGISIAKGDYLFFVDADDWLEPNALELLNKKVVETDADIVICNINHVIRKDSGEMQIIPYRIQTFFTEVTNAMQDETIIYRTETSMTDKLIKTEFMRNSGLLMPPHPYEDTPVVPVLMAYAQKVAHVPECLYNYYLNRPGNITGNSKNVASIVKSLREMKENACELNIFEQYRSAFMKYSRWMIKGVRYHITVGETEGKDIDQFYGEIMRALKCFMDENYPGWDAESQCKFVVWGSYNVRSMVAKIVNDISQIISHYSFSSILGLTKAGTKYVQIEHPNKYREDMLKKDWTKSFCQQIIKSAGDIDFLVIDFLEERYDLIAFENNYYTDSEAFREASIEGLEKFETINRMELDIKIWKEACNQWMDYLKTVFEPQQIILVKTKLCTNYGIPGTQYPYEREHEIEKMNEILESYYQYFVDKYPGIKVMECKSTLCYTDEDFIHGRYPYHMNDLQFHYIADGIESYIHNYML